MKKQKTPTQSQDKGANEKVKMIKDSWRTEERISTLPRWGQVQTKIIQECLSSLPDIDEETKKKITRNMLLTLRCHSCERARSDECNFSVCIRGLLSGQEVI
jgi:ribosomal protein L44E